MWGIAPHLPYGVPVNPTRGAGSSVQNVNVSVGQCTGAMSGGGAHNRAWIHPQVPAGTAPQTQQLYGSFVPNPMQNTHSAVLSQHLATHFGSPTHMHHQVDQTPPPPPPDNIPPWRSNQSAPGVETGTPPQASTGNQPDSPVEILLKSILMLPETQQHELWNHCPSPPGHVADFDSTFL
jgi:hypothetical protein